MKAVDPSLLAPKCSRFVCSRVIRFQRIPPPSPRGKVARSSCDPSGGVRAVRHMRSVARSAAKSTAALATDAAGEAGGPLLPVWLIERYRFDRFCIGCLILL